MRMHISPLLFVGALALAGAGLTGPSERPCRVSGMASTPVRLGGEKGSESHVVQLDEGVEYIVQAAVAAGVVRLRTVVRNERREPVRYDLQRLVIAAADGGLLRLVSTEDELSSRATDTERASEDFLRGIRVIAPNQRLAVTRRCVLADGLRLGRDPLLLSRLSLEDSVRVGDRDVGVALRLVQVR